MYKRQVNPLSDLSSSEDDPDLIISLENVFDDQDNANGSIFKEVVSNDPGLVKVSVSPSAYVLVQLAQKNNQVKTNINPDGSRWVVKKTFNLTDDPYVHEVRNELWNESTQTRYFTECKMRFFYQDGARPTAPRNRET